MTHAKLDTQADRLAEIRDIAVAADEAVATHRIYDARMIARLARLIEAEMQANDFGGLV
jgi:ATP-dependent helicase YprA (DUF1998 family)